MKYLPVLYYEEKINPLQLLDAHCHVGSYQTAALEEAHAPFISRENHRRKQMVFTVGQAVEKEFCFQYTKQEIGLQIQFNPHQIANNVRHRTK